MASASDPPAHPALQPADRLILPPQHPPAAVETSIGPPHYPAECTHSHASVQPSLRARTGHANSDSLVRLKTAIDREKFDFPAAFGSLREGLGTCSGHLKTVTGDLAGTGRARLGGMHAPPA